jgi:hypothetical protein
MLRPPVGAAVGLVEGFTPTTSTGNHGAVPGQKLRRAGLGGDGEGVQSLGCHTNSPSFARRWPLIRYSGWEAVWVGVATTRSPPLYHVVLVLVVP